MYEVTEFLSYFYLPIKDGRTYHKNIHHTQFEHVKVNYGIAIKANFLEK